RARRLSWCPPISAASATSPSTCPRLAPSSRRLSRWIRRKSRGRSSRTPAGSSSFRSQSGAEGRRHRRPFGGSGLSLYRPVVVGGVEIPGNVFLAPVAGYSDAAFRSVCFSLGADLCYTEMVSSEALTRGHPKTGLLLDRAESETRYAIQLFGSRPETLAAAALAAAERKPLLIDLNCGCPVPKVVRSGAGSALMKDPVIIRDIVAAMTAALGAGGPPVTAKIRSGWDEGSVNYREAADAAVEGGAAAVTLHARTR